MGEAKEVASSKAKELLVSTKFLIHLDPQKELVFSCDAFPLQYRSSPVSQRRECILKDQFYMLPDITAERKYSQQCKEWLAIIFVAKRFMISSMVISL